MRRPRSALARLLPLLVSFALLGCDDGVEDFTPQSFVEKLRVLAIRAEPPDVVPGGTTRLDALVADPSGGLLHHTKIWIVCDPDPTGQPTACAQQANARDPSALLRGDVPGVHLFPFENAPEYTAPTDVLDALPAGSLERMRGLDAMVLLIAFEGEDLEAFQRGEVQSQYAIKSVRIRDPSVAPNRNPRIEAIRSAGNTLSNDTATLVPPEAPLALVGIADASRVETFETPEPDGSTRTRTEEMTLSWFTTGGRFAQVGDRGLRTIGEAPATLNVPGHEGTRAGAIDVYVVLRDGRGGLDWTQRTLRVSP